MLGSFCGKTASMTTPLISTILPTLLPFVLDCSGMWLLERDRGRYETPRAPEAQPQPRQSTEPLLQNRLPTEVGPVSRHRLDTLGVVEASDIRGDQRRSVH